jgi:D-lactate dehydrogenase
MRTAVFSTKSYDKKYLEAANHAHGHDLFFYEPRLTCDTVALANGFPAVCVFVNDLVDADVLGALSKGGTRLIATRSAGFNHIDLAAAGEKGISVVRVPSYSPYSVAEHTLGLILTLNRKFHRAYARVREGNFSLDGLLGFDLHGKTVGVVGTGQIGQVVIRILHGFGCRVLAYDLYPNPDLEAEGLEYCSLEELFSRSDILTLHCPLTPETYHMINEDAISKMKTGVMLINTSRGALLDTVAVIEGLKTGKIQYLGLDVYEEEEDLFFEDLSDQMLHDDVFARLLTMPNVVITGHQAFFTVNALEKIAETTLHNLTAFEQGQPLLNAVTAEKVYARG